MVVNDYTYIQDTRGALQLIASKLLPQVYRRLRFFTAKPAATTQNFERQQPL